MITSDSKLISPPLRYQTHNGILVDMGFYLLLFGLTTIFAVYNFVPAGAQSGPGIAAIVNDEPISQFDIDQRKKLNKVLGRKSGTRKQILEELVEEHLQRQEAKRLRIPVNSKEINETITKMVQGSSSSLDTFNGRLKKVGVKPSSMRDRIEAMLAWQRVLSRRFGKLVDLDEKDIDRAHERAKKSRRPKKHFYMLQQIILPFEGVVNASVVEGRKIEAQRIVQKFKGCRSSRRIASGIYNVKIKNIGPIPVDQLQAKLRKLLRKTGPGKLLPPNLTRKGIELLAYCSLKTVTAPEVTREQVRAGLANQQYGLVSTRHLRDLKRDAIIDYR